MRTWVVLFLFLTSLGLQARGAAPVDSLRSSRNQYFYSIRSGTLIGCKGCSRENQITFAATTIHGIKFKDTWSLGIGTGFNSYASWQTMPFFGSAAVDLGKKNKLFFELDYGYAKAWLSEGATKEYGYKNAHGGRMVSPLVGYKVRYHDLRIYIVAGYSFQRVVSNYEYPNQAWVNNQLVQIEPNRKRVATEFNRLLLQIGFGWR